MLKLIVLLLLIVFGGLVLYSSNQPEVAVNIAPISAPVPVLRLESPEPVLNFKCDGRQHCSQMRSLAEAEFFLENCPDTKMDGDKDGEPCERQFR